MRGGSVVGGIGHRRDQHVERACHRPVAGRVRTVVEAGSQVLARAQVDAGVGGVGSIGHSDGQAARHRAVVVGGRHEAQRRVARQHDRVGIAEAGGGHGLPRARLEVLPLALAGVCSVAGDRHPSERARGIAAAGDARLVVERIAVRRLCDLADRGRVGRVFRDRQEGRGTQRRPVVDVGDRRRQRHRVRAVAVARDAAREGRVVGHVVACAGRESSSGTVDQACGQLARRSEIVGRRHEAQRIVRVQQEGGCRRDDRQVGPVRAVGRVLPDTLCRD